MKSNSDGRFIWICQPDVCKELAAYIICLFLLLGLPIMPAMAQPSPGPNPDQLLDSWSFSDTDWLSARGYAPLKFGHLVSVTNSGDGSSLFLDTTNSVPSYLFYNVVETGGVTNFARTNGSISLWFNPNWTSTNQGGTGPGDWGNLISLGQAGTNGSSWWSWYLDAGGSTIYFSSQTNGSASATYLTAPVSFISNHWYNLVLSYSQTNSCVYTNGVLLTNGTGVTHWPGPDVTFFAIGSDTNGSYQAGGTFDDLSTYNYQVDPDFVSGTFDMYSIVYLGAGGFSPLFLTPAPSTNTVIPTFSAVVGAGFLTGIGASPTYATSTNIWLTNYSVAIVSSNVMNLNFAIAGGSNNTPYDVFATTALVTPITNGVWYWMGQAYRGTNYVLPMTNFPPSNIFLILGKPQDTDQDGLTDAYELLVSHTDLRNADTDGDGMLDGWEVVYGTNPLTDESKQTAQRSNFLYDPVGRLETVMGVRSETIGDDFEGNVLSAH